MSLDEVFQHALIDDHLDAYREFIPKGWAGRVSQIFEPRSDLDRLFFELLISWRTTSYVAQFPFIMMKSIEGTSVGFAEDNAPDSYVIEAVAHALEKVGKSLPEVVKRSQLRKELTEQLIQTAKEFRERASKIKPEFPIINVWNGYLQIIEFRSAIWSSQSTCFIAFYDAYERFVIDVLKVILGRQNGSLRTNDADFKETLKTGFIKNIQGPVWTDDKINRVRTIRNALVHNGGKLTRIPKPYHKSLRLIDGILQIFPEDNQEMLRTLSAAVELILTMTPKQRPC